LEDGRSENNKVSGRMWEAVETSSGKIGTGKTKGERSKERSRKEIREERQEKKTEKSKEEAKKMVSKKFHQ